jgi:ATP-dependent exoDNAse (exonuclease V) alpha subunit
MELGSGSPIVLSKEFKEVLQQMETTRHAIFITGRAGTGKSTLLRLFRKTTKLRTAVVAPTGIAALNVKGTTIHSFFGFPPKLLHPSDIYERRNSRVYRNLDVLIIDEISMVRADMMDNIDYFLRVNRNNYQEAFGGVKVIFFGDMFQLPPVVAKQAEREYIAEHYESPYFFSAKVWQDDTPLEIFELQEVYRQTDRSFIRILDNVRTQDIDYDDLEDLNNRYVEDYDDDWYITLCARNDQVHRINREKLAEVESEEFTYLASVTGNFSERLFPTELALKLRVGAQVMFIKNDSEKMYVNGTIGKIIELDTNKVVVAILQDDGTIQRVDVDKFTWEILKYKPDPADQKLLKTEEIGSFTQYPLRLAWAVTIHKSQGKTFDRAIIDLGRGAFESGQAYVALSRCRILEGIILKQKLRPRDIFVDRRITEFFLNNR